MLTLALHHEAPPIGSPQSTFEVAYDGYERVALSSARDLDGGGESVRAIKFPRVPQGATGTVTHISLAVGGSVVLTHELAVPFPLGTMGWFDLVFPPGALRVKPSETWRRAPLRCSVCDRAAIVLDGQVIRACRHDAPVIGEMSARVVAVGGMAFGTAPPSGG